MKRLLVPILPLVLLACNKETKIEFNLTDLPEGAVVEVFKNSGDIGREVYRGIPVNGICQFSLPCDSIDESTSYGIMLGDTVTYCSYGSRWLYIEDGGKAVVTGSGDSPYRWTVKSTHPRQAFEDQFDMLCTDGRVEMRLLETMASKASSRAEKDSLYSLADSIDRVIMNATLDLLAKVDVNDWWIEKVSRFASILNENPEAECRPKIEKLYERLSDDQKQTSRAKKIYSALYTKAPKIGDKIQDYTLYDINEKAYRISDYAGKTLLLDFSSSGCGPCRMVVPLLEYLSESSGDNFEIITLMADNRSSFEKAINEIKPTYTTLYDHDSDCGFYALNKIFCYPTFMVISPEGIIEDMWLGVDIPKIVNIVKTKGWKTIQETISKQDGVTVVSNPVIDNFSSYLTIDKVTLSADSTVVEFIGVLPSKFSIGGGSELRYGNGKKSKIVSSSIGLDNFVDCNFGELFKFTATFEPLPEDVKEFDFVECEQQGCFKVEGVKIAE